MLVRDRSGEVLSFRCRIQPGRPAELISRVSTRDAAAIVVSNLGDQSAVFSSAPTAVANLEDRGRVPLPPEGLLLQSVPTSGVLEVTDGARKHPIPLESSSSPLLTVWVSSDRNVGTLLVETNVEDAVVVLNGQPRTAMQLGRWQASLEPKQYHVRVVREGYEDAPEQIIEIKKGDSARLHFELQARAVVTALTISGGTPGAEVRIGDRRVGALDATGAFHTNVQPGELAIELRKEFHEPLPLRRTISAGQTVTIGGTQAQMRPFGAVEFDISPPTARVQYRREGDSQSSPAPVGQTVRVPEGVYIVDASADKHEGRNERVQVAAGKTVPLRWVLEAVKVAAPPPPVIHVTSDYFTNSEEWKQEEDDWYSVDGNGYSWFRSSNGTFRMDIQKGKRGLLGRKKTVWVVAYRDERNYVSYELSGGELKRKAVVNGGSTDEAFPHSMGRDKYYSLSITIEPKRIVHRDGKGAVIDVFARGPDDDFTKGRFGFKGDATVRIKN